MSHWHPRPAAQIGLRALGLALILSLAPLGAWLRWLTGQSHDVTPAQWLLAAACFIIASLGVTLLLLGPDLMKPVAIAQRWHDHPVRTPAYLDMMGKIAPDGHDACSSPADRPGSQHRLTLERT